MSLEEGVENKNKKKEEKKSWQFYDPPVSKSNLLLSFLLYPGQTSILVVTCNPTSQSNQAYQSNPNNAML